MEGKMGFLFLIMLGAAWVCDARELVNLELYRKPDLCSACEEYSTQVLDYLKDNNTQVEIIDSLHNTCLQLRSLNQQCGKLVDYYAPLFFSEIAQIQPGELCEKFNLCESAKIFSKVQRNSCGLCKEAIEALLVELNDPDTKLEILEKLLKACDSVEKYKKECKRAVFEYGPLILANAEKFLKTTDICTALHACPASTIVSQEATTMEETPLFSDS
ncbi:uncharacterized protein LOC131601576 [Vicia villosa]|uniref:uncharacterized protein LOC131601576 n=1 Tax=Vicia villosa TaxID=3911 RepID=UPI00273B025C|nr:uncharacterized protein LOC131601576 [Vicia villosa]XP_058729410.1 uncharacterized protein LOC131601576 [Vicia villosa]